MLGSVSDALGHPTSGSVCIVSPPHGMQSAGVPTYAHNSPRDGIEGNTNTCGVFPQALAANSLSLKGRSPLALGYFAELHLPSSIHMEPIILL